MGNNENIPWEIEIDKCALLVIDMQNEFVQKGALKEVPNLLSLISKFKELIHTCRRCKVPVIYTAQTFDPLNELCRLEVKMYPELKNQGLRKGTYGHLIYEEVAPITGEVIIEKRRYSAFFNTELDIVLKNIKGINQIDTIIICGTQTNVCCESTARDAFYRDYKVVFCSDLNVTIDERLQWATLENIRTSFGRVVHSDTIIKTLLSYLNQSS